ncbi:hypothetical protein RIF29_47150 [Crotalaria pallida]|uniref:Uncharacterized protein n=1 Tax=Crotalaria pallida TaxID=3830 RepID=A0AAN9DS15_CROPI
MGMHATKDRVESETSTVYSISLYESTITTRDEPWFGELKLALGVKGLPVTARVTTSGAEIEEIEHENKKQARLDHFDREGWRKMFFDTPRTWILYEPMDRDKSLLLAMTSSFITSSFPYPSPLFSVTHQMALSSYL